jgi:hypothetical protein
MTEAMADYVLTRDAVLVRERLGRDAIVCLAPLAGGSRADCWGRTIIEHIKDESRMAVRAESDDPRHLASLCQGHTEDGRKAGYQWNTATENRAAMRDLMREIETDGQS